MREVTILFGLIHIVFALSISISFICIPPLNIHCDFGQRQQNRQKYNFEFDLLKIGYFDKLITILIHFIYKNLFNTLNFSNSPYVCDNVLGR